MAFSNTSKCVNFLGLVLSAVANLQLIDFPIEKNKIFFHYLASGYSSDKTFSSTHNNVSVFVLI